ncbi:bglB [Symbiodinium natans]|uniref:BglB protein n=1 Tax=Symbiodinium natans TaxID=878477 RepID=A0A812QXE6_9DINO|nr:bglB [Symbiodinium natans]
MRGQLGHGDQLGANGPSLGGGHRLACVLAVSGGANTGPGNLTSLEMHFDIWEGAFFLGPREFEEAGAEGYRLQEQLDVGNKYYTKYWQENGRTNGTVVACRQMHERGPHDVGSLLVFADAAAEAEFTHQGLGLLDAAYFKAVKMGLQTAGSAMYLGGRYGSVKQGGLLGILLANPADSAVGLGGCTAVGPFWEVFEADASPRASVIQRISDPTSQEKDTDGRRLSMTTAEAISKIPTAWAWKVARAEAAFSSKLKWRSVTFWFRILESDSEEATVTVAPAEVGVATTKRSSRTRKPGLD